MEIKMTTKNETIFRSENKFKMKPFELCKIFILFCLPVAAFPACASTSQFWSFSGESHENGLWAIWVDRSLVRRR